ncbi:MAG: hypothetical protein WC315_00825 [Candidatus Omnitrophota bacterium]|jgi:hypothetical protein
MHIIGFVPPEWLDAIVESMNAEFPGWCFSGVDLDTIVAEYLPHDAIMPLIEAYLDGVNDAWEL